MNAAGMNTADTNTADTKGLNQRKNGEVLAGIDGGDSGHAPRVSGSGPSGFWRNLRPSCRQIRFKAPWAGRQSAMRWAAFAFLAIAAVIAAHWALPGLVWAQGVNAIPGDATLSGVLIEGEAIVDFDGDTRSYTVGVASSAAILTVAATAVYRDSTVSYKPVDADDATDGHQVAVSEGGRVRVTITVTNGTKTGIYKVAINRGRSGDKQWLASKDIYGLPAALDKKRYGRGIWSDGATLWAVNSAGPSSVLRAFDLETGARRSSDDIAIGTLMHTVGGQARSIEQPWGVAGMAAVPDRDGGIWVLSTRSLIAAQGYSRDRENDDWQANDELVNRCVGQLGTKIRGLWTNGEMLWVGVDDSQPRVAAYRVGCDGGGPVPSEGFYDLDQEGNDAPTGIWADGEHIWVADSQDRMLYAYDMVTKQRVTSKEFGWKDLRADGNPVNPWGIWSNGRTMWVMDNSEYIYSYRMPVSDNTDLGSVRFDGVPVLQLDLSRAQGTVGVPNDATSGTLTVTPRHFRAQASETSGSISVASGTDTFTTTVTAQDGTMTKDYTLTVGRVPGGTTPSINLQPYGRVLTVGWSAPADAGTSGVTSYEIHYARAPDGADEAVD